ncbi:reverse transcriptase domain-containing protein [Tanacetum coccineum]
MRTRSQSRNLNRQQQQVPPVFVKPFNLVEPIENQAPPVITMADNRTMAQLLEAPTEGYEDAIVVPEITADNFELKHRLLTLVQNKQFFEHDKEDPHAHIRYFNKITSTIKFPNVPSTSVKLMLFPFSLEGVARIWLEKEPPRSILTWDDLVSKFINKFFPPSKTTNLEMKSSLVEREKQGDKGTRCFLQYRSTKMFQPPGCLSLTHVPNSEPVVAPVSVLMPNLKPSISYPSRRIDERRHEKANDQIEKFYEIFKDLSFEISLTDALILYDKNLGHRTLKP